MTLRDLVNSVAVKKIVTNHSKPWIDKKIAESLKQLRCAKKHSRRHSSPQNVRKFNDLLQSTMKMIDDAKEAWWREQCDELSSLNDKEQWKRINKMIGDQQSKNVQPIRT